MLQSVSCTSSYHYHPHDQWDALIHTPSLIWVTEWPTLRMSGISPTRQILALQRENITSGLHGNYSLQINIISGDYIYSMDLFISSGMSLCYFILQQDHSHMNKHDEASEGCYFTLIPLYFISNLATQCCLITARVSELSRWQWQVTGHWTGAAKPTSGSGNIEK